MYRNGRRVPAPRTKPPAMRHKPFVSPSAGWYSAVNLASAPPGAAKVLENWLPTATGIRMRRGSVKQATADADNPMASAFAYVGTDRRMFGAADGSVYDLTSVADPDVAPAADISGQTSDYYSAVNFATPGGQFMLIANGTDEIQTYDGTNWTALASGTDPGELDGVDSEDIAHLNVYRNRIWGVEGGTQSAWYWPTDSIAGAVEEVSLRGVFRRGGSLLFTATWSLDAGDGLDDKIVFVSSEGEVAVYQGDPTDTGAWGLVGRYDAAPPLGKNAFLTVGGDLLILTDIGLIPLSAIISKDPGALALAAVSRNIQPDWLNEVSARRALPWEIVKWTANNVAFVSCPVTSDESITPPICFAVNLETGAWSKVTGWNTRCFVLHDNRVFFGTNGGTLIEAEVTGADQGQVINYCYIGHADHLGAVGQYKTVAQSRAVFRATSDFNSKVDVVADYTDYLPQYPDAAPQPDNLGVWDVGNWDEMLWDTGNSYRTMQTYWRSIGKSGFVHSPIVLASSGSVTAPSAELVIVEVTYLPGQIVT